LIPPTTKKELFARLLGVIEKSWQTMPATARSAGTGGPGNFLEDLLGLNVGSQDIADSIGWEVKYYTEQTNLITLFHKEPRPDNIVRYMVRKWGLKDKQGRMSFRHTIRGRSEKFKVETDANQVTVRPLQGNGPTPYWTHNDLLNAAGAKLRRLVLMKGERDGVRVRFLLADCFENLNLQFLVYEMICGTIAIEFDAREATPGSDGLRNHGTKFRVPPEEVCRLYMKKERLS
jgi:hypothetical protein